MVDPERNNFAKEEVPLTPVALSLPPQERADLLHPVFSDATRGRLQHVQVLGLALAEPDLELGRALTHLGGQAEVGGLQEPRRSLDKQTLLLGLASINIEFKYGTIPRVR